MTQSQPEHLLLIDGLNIVRRIYEAIQIPDSPDKAKRAIGSSVGSVRRALQEHNPTHVLAAFDHGGPTWRHALYGAYHSSRKPKPEPLKEAIPKIIKLIEDLGVCTIKVPEVEADDVIATVFGHWKARSHGRVTILSTDKDLASLVSEGARVFDHFGGSWRDEAWVVKKFGVDAARLQDLLALTGDATDDIPGVPGVGPKTAAKWLNEHGSLDVLIERAGAITGKAGEALRANIDQARLSRQLVEFKTDLSLGLTWKALRYTGAKAAA